MSKNLFLELSEAAADAAERAGKSTVLVDARRKFPASGIAISADTILTADHVIERDEDIKILLADGTELNARLAGRDPGSAHPRRWQRRAHRRRRQRDWRSFGSGCRR